jgi:hypothetical protein
VRAPWTPLLLALLSGLSAADAPEPAFEAVREGLLSPGRGAREEAERKAREMARTDPSGVAALWERVDLEGRCLLAHALGAAGTSHAAEVGLERAAEAPDEIYRSLLDGLAEGGEASLFAKAPETLSPARKEALEEVRFRYRVEGEMARLKSTSGPTGHYTGQFKRLKDLGPGVLPILFDMLMDRARPLPGESAAGPYRCIHPGMDDFDRSELREMAAYAFGEVGDKGDKATLDRLEALYRDYSQAMDPDSRFEREQLAPDVAFSLHDLGRTGPALRYIRSLEASLRDRAYSMFGGRDVEQALWDLAYGYCRIGEHEKGERVYQDYLRVSSMKAIAAYNLACSFSMRASESDDDSWRDRYRKDALDYLEMSIKEYNYGDWKWMEEDGDLSFIRTEPKYRELLRYLQEKYPERKKGNVPKGRSFQAPR